MSGYPADSIRSPRPSRRSANGEKRQVLPVSEPMHHSRWALVACLLYVVIKSTNVIDRIRELEAYIVINIPNTLG